MTLGQGRDGTVNDAAKLDALGRVLGGGAFARHGSNATAHYALMTVLVLLDAEVAAREAGETAVRLAPYDGTIAGGFATRLIIRGEYDRGLALLRRSRDLAPGSEPWRHFYAFLACFGRGDIETAASAAMALRGTEDPLYLAAMAIGHAVRGEMERAAEAKAARLVREPDARDMFERGGIAPPS